MDTEFWHERWANNEIAFHEGEANALLVKYFHRLALTPGSRVFLPLCGKTRDIAWLLSQGFHVVGAELSALAIEQLFTELPIEPTIIEHTSMTRYQAKGIDIWVGDIFDLQSDTLGRVDAVYDRAALVALPKALRERYTQHLMAMTRSVPQLLICYDYDQQKMDGPPFSISDNEVNAHYQKVFQLTRLASEDVEGGVKGLVAAQEKAWLMVK